MSLPDPDKLDHEDMMEALRCIQQTMFPNGKTNAEWDANTLMSVAGILSDSGLAPADE